MRKSKYEVRFSLDRRWIATVALDRRWVAGSYFSPYAMESYTFIVFSKFLYFHGLVDQHSVGRKTSIL